LPCRLTYSREEDKLRHQVFGYDDYRQSVTGNLLRDIRLFHYAPVDSLDQTVVKMIFYFLCALPLVIHVFDDRNGDNRKLNDLLALSAGSLIMAFIFSFIGIEWYKTLAAIFGWHFGYFDYLIVHFLRRNNVISHKARWFTYIGKSSKADQLWARFSPWVRFIIRLSVFVACSLIYFL
jgi:hypothetical protein